DVDVRRYHRRRYHSVDRYWDRHVDLELESRRNVRNCFTIASEYFNRYFSRNSDRRFAVGRNRPPRRAGPARPAGRAARTDRWSDDDAVAGAGAAAGDARSART